MTRMKRSADGTGLHVIYKRQAEQEDFCGIDNTITSEELDEDEAGVTEDVYVVGRRLVQESDLIVSQISETLDTHCFTYRQSRIAQKYSLNGPTSCAHERFTLLGRARYLRG